jgi:hypothetical protein
VHERKEEEGSISSILRRKRQSTKVRHENDVFCSRKAVARKVGHSNCVAEIIDSGTRLLVN